MRRQKNGNARERGLYFRTSGDASRFAPAAAGVSLDASLEAAGAEGFATGAAGAPCIAAGVAMADEELGTAVGVSSGFKGAVGAGMAGRDSASAGKTTEFTTAGSSWSFT